MLLHRLSPETAGKVILDVGCARGDFSHEVQSLWNRNGFRMYDEVNQGLCTTRHYVLGTYVLGTMY
jgi:hypothetical protein